MADILEASLSTSDLDRSRQFFEGSLGMAPARVGDSSVSYETGECELKLQADFPPDVREAFNLPVPPVEARGGGVMHVLALEDPLETLYEATVADEAASALIEPRESPWGVRMFLARSPEGYLLEVRGADS